MLLLREQFRVQVVRGLKGRAGKGARLPTSVCPDLVTVYHTKMQ